MRKVQTLFSEPIFPLQNLRAFKHGVKGKKRQENVKGSSSKQLSLVWVGGWGASENFRRKTGGIHPITKSSADGECNKWKEEEEEEEDPKN